MSFTFVMSGSARRQIAERLPKAAAIACLEFILGPLADDPRRVGAALREPFAGEWRARRGAYRVRYRIGEDLGRSWYWTWTTVGTPTAPEGGPPRMSSADAAQATW